MTSTSAIMASQTVEATEKYGATSSKTETTYNVWKNTDKAFFDEVKGNKDLTRQFANYMKNVTSGKATSIQHLVTGFDWASLGEITIVDVSLAIFIQLPSSTTIKEEEKWLTTISSVDLTATPASR